MKFVRRPTRAGVRDAAAKIAAVTPPSPLFSVDVQGVPVAFKCECLQPIGAFKLRGAWHRLTAIDIDLRGRGVVAFSSGNHAQGVAWAARKLGMPAVIVMPADAPRSKREGTLALGAEIVDYDRETESREQIAGRLAEARGSVLVPSFDDPWVIEGQGSAGIEAAVQMEARGLGPVVHVVVPCGGGGLAAGIALGLPDAMVTVVEPEGWDDMRRSLEAGWIEEVGLGAPPTACDALQTTRVSDLTFDVRSAGDPGPRHAVDLVARHPDVLKLAIRQASEFAKRLAVLQVIADLGQDERREHVISREFPTSTSPVVLHCI